MTRPLSSTESRARQVEIEGQLAQSLARAAPDERPALYGRMYDQIYDMHFSRDPDVLDFGATPALVGFLGKLTRAGNSVVEVGCGGGLLAIEMAREGRHVLGLDVSARVLQAARRRAGDAPCLRLELTRGTAIPTPDATFDFAYSVEVLEHLHPEDVAAHLQEVHRVLKPGGRYWLLTPNRLDGITSADRFAVDMTATGDVHLKEWTYSELDAQLRRAGFRSLRSPWRNTRLTWLPLCPVAWFATAERLPAALLRRRRARSILGIVACSIVAAKPRSA